MPNALHDQLASYIANEIRDNAPRLLVGLCGSQGSGKSTLAASVKQLLKARKIHTVVLSIDDLYLTRKERTNLSESVHPLLQTRGVPGTHDVTLGLEVLNALTCSGRRPLPCFDKARDDRRPLSHWPVVRTPARVVIFEGWCIGAIPENDAALIEPVNELERNEDSQGTWRRYVNQALAGDYQRLFAMIDRLIMLKAPSFDVVYGWRLEQEQRLLNQALAEGADPALIMNDEQVRRFISFYERLTLHMLHEMPSRADAVIELDSSRRPLAVRFKEKTAG